MYAKMLSGWIYCVCYGVMYLHSTHFKDMVSCLFLVYLLIAEITKCMYEMYNI